MLQQAARGTGPTRVDGILAHIDMLDSAFLIDDERGAVGKLLFFVEDAILLGDRSLEVAQEREIDSLLFGKRRVGGRAVDADAQHLGSGLLEFGDISLIRLELLGSATGECQNVESQHDIFLSQKIAQLHLLAGLVGQAEVRGSVANLEGSGLRCQGGAQDQGQNAPLYSHPFVHRSPPQNVVISIGGPVRDYSEKREEGEKRIYFWEAGRVQAARALPGSAASPPF